MPERVADRVWLGDREKTVELVFMKLTEIGFFTDRVTQMTDFYWGRSADLRDPDGHQIEIMRLEN